MELKEIEELYKNDDSVKKYIDSIADKRVNQYRDRFIEKELPSLVEAKAEERINRDREERDRLMKEETFHKSLLSRLEGEYIAPEIGIKFFDGLGADSSEDEIESRFEEFKTLQEETTQRVVTKRLGGVKPEAGDKREKLSMSDMTTKEILKNMGSFSNP